MLESIRTAAAARLRVPTGVLLPAASILGFAWLLAQDRIHPLAVCLLQLYLSF